MTESAVLSLRDHYRGLFHRHGDSPLATQISAAGQSYRFRKLFEIGDLNDASVLDVGCGLGEMYPALLRRYPRARYEGIDIVLEMVAAAGRKYPEVAFRAVDLLSKSIPERYDFVLLSGVFNNAMADATGYLENLVERAWSLATRGLAFNFLPIHVNFTQPTMAYHDPARVVDFSLRRLSRKVRFEHHYQRCDAVVFVYR
jgi:SAM-dependent methyltransferase